RGALVPARCGGNSPSSAPDAGECRPRGHVRRDGGAGECAHDSSTARFAARPGPLGDDRGEARNEDRWASAWLTVGAEAHQLAAGTGRWWTATYHMKRRAEVTRSRPASDIRDSIFLTLCT